MGPSGGGKSSFLTTLAGKASYGVVSGHVFINGQPGWLTDPRFKHLVGFVPQDDVMMRDLTVEENIVSAAFHGGSGCMHASLARRNTPTSRAQPPPTSCVAQEFAALTRLPSSWSRERKLAFADRVISVLGLEDVRESLIGDETTRGISGGQRKRVNIGIEMAADPSIILLDEPTSGLDSAGSLQVWWDMAVRMDRGSSKRVAGVKWLHRHHV